MIPHVDDDPQLVDLKLRKWNLLVFLQRDLSRDVFEQASQKLRELWKDWESWDSKRNIL